MTNAMFAACCTGNCQLRCTIDRGVIVLAQILSLGGIGLGILCGWSILLYLCNIEVINIFWNILVCLFLTPRCDTWS